MQIPVVRHRRPRTSGCGCVSANSKYTPLETVFAHHHCIRGGGSRRKRRPVRGVLSRYFVHTEEQGRGRATTPEYCCTSKSCPPFSAASSISTSRARALAPSLESLAFAWLSCTSRFLFRQQRTQDIFKNKKRVDKITLQVADVEQLECKTYYCGDVAGGKSLI